MGKKLKDGWMVPGREKLAMVVGYGSTNGFSVLVSTFMTTYLLMVGIDAKIAALVLLIIKVWDAINDVLFGYLLDRVRFKEGTNRFTKWLFSGRYMPWFRLLLLSLPIGTVIIYSINTSAPMWLRITQYVIGYLLYDLGMSITGVTTVLPLSVTNDYNERNFITAYTGLGQGFGSLPVLAFATFMIAGSFGYTKTVLIFAIYCFILGLFPALVVKERNPGVYIEKSNEHYTLKEMLAAVKSVPEYIFLQIATFIAGIFSTAQYGLLLSYYIYHNASIAGIITICSVIPAIVAIPFLPGLFKRVNKMTVAKVCYGIALVCALTMVVGGRHFFSQNVGLSLFITGIQISASTVAVFGVAMMNPDIIEKAKYKTGRDIAGIFGAINSFVTKLVNSMTTTVSLLILSAYGWVSVEAASFAELAELNQQGIGLQTEMALQGLWDVSYLYPMIGSALAFVCYFFIRVNRHDAQVYMKANAGEITHEEAEALLTKNKSK